MPYASQTTVSEDRSRAEIERMLMKAGAEEFGYIRRRTEAMICFTYRSVPVRMAIPLPDRGDDVFWKTPARRDRRSEAAAFAAWEKECRRRWRSLCLVIKALLVGVAEGVISFEQAFMAHIVWGNGMTTYQMLLPRIERVLAGDGSMPKALPRMLTDEA